MIRDKTIRTTLTKENFFYFFNFYYAHYVKYPTAPFQKEMMNLLEDNSDENLYIVSFRNSGKSTLVTTAYPIWALLGKQQKKFVIIFCQTQAQAKQHMMNIRNELENNSLLKKDLGPFQEVSDEWGSHSLVFSNSDARITVASTEQSVRGLRHHEHRPDLIVCDDVEDIASTKTREGRQKTYNWLRGDVIPAGDRNTRLIVVGNLLHEDSLLMRLKEDLISNNAEGQFKYYPLIDEENKCLWPGKYPTQEDLIAERKKVGNEIAWQREYLLNIVPDENPVVRREWIKYYEAPPSDGYLQSIRIGVDLAISKKSTADYTAMVIGRVYKKDEKYTLYIDPIVINQRMSFPETVAKCKELHDALKSERRPDLIVEDVGYQGALPELLQQSGLSVRGMKIGSQDKKSRLHMAGHKIKSGEIMFPQAGCEILINQIVNFGTEKHDDMVDALTILVLDMIDNRPITPNIRWL